MDDLKVSAITALNIRKILRSSELSDTQKANFLRKNAVEIKHVLQTTITKQEFAQMMQTRPLIRFRPFKNSFTKRGDKILLAKSLGIKEREIEEYIQNVVDKDLNAQPTISFENIDKVKTYVYRHGKKDQVVRVLDYELSNVNTILQKLYTTMEDNSGGLADYFSRPIHRMDNKTLVKLYGVVDKNLRNAHCAGIISDEQLNSTAEWALIRIYQIQNNSKLIRTKNFYKDLTIGV